MERKPSENLKNNKLQGEEEILLQIMKDPRYEKLWSLTRMFQPKDEVELINLFNEDKTFRNEFNELKSQLRRKINSYKITINLLEGQLKTREELLKNQRKNFLRELTVLREELFKTKTIDGYEPQDYVFEDFSINNSPSNSEKKNHVFNIKEFERRKIDYFNKKNVMLRKMKEKNQKMIRTLQRLKKMEEEKKKEIDNIKKEEINIKSLEESLNEEKERLMESTKEYEKKISNYEKSVMEKEKQTQLAYLRQLIEDEEKRLDSVQERIKSAKRQARSSERVFRMQDAVWKKKKDTEEKNYERKKNHLQEKTKDLEKTVEEYERKLKKMREEEIRIKRDVERMNEERIKKEELLRQMTGGEAFSRRTYLDKEGLGKLRRKSYQLLNQMNVEIREEFNKFQGMVKRINKFISTFYKFFRRIKILKNRLEFYTNERKVKMKRVSQINRLSGLVLRMHEKGSSSELMTIVYTQVHSKPWEFNYYLMEQSMKMLNENVRRCIQEYHGYELRHEGDSFKIAFKEPLDALKFGIKIHQMLNNEKWPKELLQVPNCELEKDVKGGKSSILYNGLKITVAINFGRAIVENDPKIGKLDYFGDFVKTCKRMVHMFKKGGITIISEAYYKKISDILSDTRKEIVNFGTKLSVKEIGRHFLFPINQVDKESGANSSELSTHHKLYVVLPQNLKRRSVDMFQDIENYDPDTLESNVQVLMNFLKIMRSRCIDHENEIKSQLNSIAENQNKIEKDNLIYFLQENVKLMRENYARFLKQDSEEGKDIISRLHSLKVGTDGMLRDYQDLLNESHSLQKKLSVVWNLFKYDIKHRIDNYENLLKMTVVSMENNSIEALLSTRKWKLKEEKYTSKINEQMELIGQRDDMIKTLQSQINQLNSVPEEFQKILQMEKRKNDSEILKEKVEIDRLRMNIMKQKNELENMEKMYNEKSQRQLLNFEKSLKEKEEQLKKKIEKMEINLLDKEAKLSQKSKNLDVELQKKIKDKVKKKFDVDFEEQSKVLNKLEKEIKKEKKNEEVEEKYEIEKEEKLLLLRRKIEKLTMERDSLKSQLERNREENNRSNINDNGELTKKGNILEYEKKHVSNTLNETDKGKDRMDWGDDLILSEEYFFPLKNKEGKKNNHKKKYLYRTDWKKSNSFQDKENEIETSVLTSMFTNDDDDNEKEKKKEPNLNQKHSSNDLIPLKERTGKKEKIGVRKSNKKEKRIRRSESEGFNDEKDQSKKVLKRRRENEKTDEKQNNNNLIGSTKKKEGFLRNINKANKLKKSDSWLFKNKFYIKGEKIDGMDEKEIKKILKIESEEFDNERNLFEKRIVNLFGLKEKKKFNDYNKLKEEFQTLSESLFQMLKKSSKKIPNKEEKPKYNKIKGKKTRNEILREEHRKRNYRRESSFVKTLRKENSKQHLNTTLPVYSKDMDSISYSRWLQRYLRDNEKIEPISIQTKNNRKRDTHNLKLPKINNEGGKKGRTNIEIFKKRNQMLLHEDLLKQKQELMQKLVYKKNNKRFRMK